MRGVEHDDDEAAAFVSLDRKIERARFAEVDIRRGRNPGGKLFVFVGKLHRTSQRQQLNVFELNVAGGFVFTFAWIELRNDAVEDVPVVVDDENVLDAN